MSRCEQCIIREYSSLNSLTKKELANISDTKSLKLYKKGENLFTEGSHIGGVFCVKEGICKISKINTNGKDTILKLAGKGELLGQRSMITDQESNLSAVALEDTTVCFIPKAEIMRHFSKNNKFSLSITRDLCNHLKEADQCLVDHNHKPVRERVAATLLYIEKTGGSDPESGALNIILNRQELANMIGTTSETCIRILSDFKKEGLVEVSGKDMILLDLKELQNIANSKTS